MNTQELIIVEQLPIITERLKVVSDEILAKTSEALSLECNEDTVKQVKTLRAQLNKDFTGWEERRKAVKTAVLTPYEQFEAVYKEMVSSQYKEADTVLKQRVDAVEGELKQQKYDEVQAYFNEYGQSKGIDTKEWGIDLASAGCNVTLSASLKSLKAQAKAYIDRICDDLALIETQEHKDEIMVEYRRSLNCSQAITAVTERHKALAEQEARRQEQEQRKAVEQAAVAKVEEVAPLAPPVEQPAVEIDPVKTVSFKVTAPLSKLRELKAFLNEGGYEYV